MNLMSAQRNLIGQQFGRGIVIAEAGRTPNQNMIWKLRCDCGVEYEGRSSDILHGRISSCGCLRQELKLNNAFSTTHGFARHKTGRHPAYRAWRGMKNVCTNPNDKNYRLYGGRGITFDKSWNRFEAFWADMGSEWEPGTRFKRSNTDGDFTARNCFWQIKSREKRIIRVIKALAGSRFAPVVRPSPRPRTLGELWGRIAV
jgi:hypothetical protein